MYLYIYIIWGVWHVVCGTLYIDVRILQHPWFLVSTLSWALEPVGRNLMSTQSFGGPKNG